MKIELKAAWSLHLSRIILSLSLALVLGANVAVAQSEDTYGSLIEGMICKLTEVSLEAEGKTSALKQFQKSIVEANECDYAHIRPFLRGVNPVPEAVLEMVNLLHYEYGEARLDGLSAEQQSAMLLDFFEEPAFTAFAERHASAMKAYQSDIEGLVYEAYGISPVVEEEAADEPDTVIIDPAGPRPDVAAQSTLSDEPKYTQWVNRLLFWSFMLLILAVVVYLGYQFYEDREERKAAQSQGVQSRAVVSADAYGTQLADMQDQIERQGAMLDGLMQEIEELHERLNNAQSSGATVAAAPPSEIPAAPTAPAAPAVAPTPAVEAPEAEGAIFGASPTVDGVTLEAVAESPLLEVEILERHGKASFQLHPQKAWTADELASWVGRYPEVVKTLNEYDAQATRLSTMEEGLAEWRNGRWQITVKALVYFK